MDDRSGIVTCIVEVSELKISPRKSPPKMRLLSKIPLCPNLEYNLPISQNRSLANSIIFVFHNNLST